MMPSALPCILENLLCGSPLHEEQQKQLEYSTLQDQLRANAFGINPENVQAMLKSRSQLLPGVYAALEQWQHCHKLAPRSLLESLWHLWLPLALQLVEYRRALNRPLIQGILGSQGTGKSTLAAVLTLILSHMGYTALSLSLDDLYKTYAERQQLQKQDPRLIWRGPPGTHDVQLGIQVLDQLRLNLANPISIPRFDKSAQAGAGDRTAPDVVGAVDLVLFEGWFVGVHPIDPVVFATAPPPIYTETDRLFARDMNARLQAYLPLWARLDRLLLLYPLNYRLSQQWRRQAEHEAIAAGKSGMSDATIDQFVEYFWRALHPELFLKPLLKDAHKVDLVIEINPDHSFGKVYRPGNLPG